MDVAQQACVTIINKNYPPNTGITGESANQLAAFLLEAGLMVSIIHTNAKYGSRNAAILPRGDVISIKSLYNGKNKLVRLVTSYIESYRLINTARKKTHGPVIVMTDPPFLIYWASRLFKERKWAYWSMDLYPEGFVAAGLTNKNGMLFRFFKKVVLKNPPHFIISLGQLQHEFLMRDYKKQIPGAALPCGIWNACHNDYQLPDWRLASEKLFFGYCGNLGEAHSLDFVKAVIRSLDPERHCFILSVYGAKATDILDYSQKFPVVRIVSSVQRKQLAHIDVHLVTLKSEWNHVCVPSKAVSAVCAGSPIFFCGTPDNDNWNYLHEAGWFVDERHDIEAQVLDIIAQIDRNTVNEKRKRATELSETLLNLQQKAYNAIAEFAKSPD